MTKKEIIAPGNVHKSMGYAHAVKVGNTVYVAGQAAVDLDGNIIGIGDFSAQVAQTFENMKRVLEASGANLGNVVKTTAYFTNLDALPIWVDVRKKYLDSYTVAGTVVEISRLAFPEMLIEVDAIAVID
ncbi:RidA family protein [Chloroflexota bacterium]